MDNDNTNSAVSPAPKPKRNLLALLTNIISLIPNEGEEYFKSEGEYALNRAAFTPPENMYSIWMNVLQYLGKHIRSENWGSRDDHGGAETFDNNGIETRIVYDYEGLTCFKQVQCLDDMGMPIDVSVANPPMELCDMTFNCELMIDPVKKSNYLTADTTANLIINPSNPTIGEQQWRKR